MACIFPKENGFNLNQFRWLKDLQLFQFVLHCSLTSEFFPHLNAFQIHIVYGTYSYTSLHLHHPLKLSSGSRSLPAKMMMTRILRQPKWRGFDCEMLVALVVGDDDLRFVRRWDSSCIAKRLSMAQQKRKMRGSPKNPFGMVDVRKANGLLFNPPGFEIHLN